MGRPTKAVSIARLTSALAVGLIVLAGCGSDVKSQTAATSTSTIPSEPPRLVTNAQIAAQRDGTPVRALLSWWQAAQFRDAKGVARLTSQSLKSSVSTARLRRIVTTAGPALGGLTVKGAAMQGARAQIRVLIVTYRGQTNVVNLTEPYTLDLVRGPSGWQFDSAEYVRGLARAYGVR